MSDLYTRYLKNQGIRAPYEQMTEAQINETNKMNPLGGFGFMSAAQRRQKQQEQQLYAAMLKRQEDKEMEAMLMRSPPERAIGHYAGQGIGGLLSALFSKKQGPSPEPTDDPEVTEYNELASEVGPAQAKLILGQRLVQRGNPAGAAMIQEAQQEIMETEKAGLDIENLQGQIDERKKKPNQVLTMSTMVDGKPAEKEMEIIGKDGEGNNIYRELSKGLKGSVTDTQEGWGRTGSQKGKALEEFENEMVMAENFLDTNDRIKSLAENSPTGAGFASALAAQANNLVYGFHGIRDIVSGNLDNKAKAKLASSDPVKQYDGVFKNIRGAAQLDAQVKALLLEQAYLMATANGQRATDRDIENALTQLGGSLNDPEAFAKIIQQSRELTVDKLMNRSKNTGGPDGKTLGEVYAQRLGGIKSRRNPEKVAEEDDSKARARLEELRERNRKRLEAQQKKN